MESILKPSKTILRGFQSVTIATEAGTTLSGFLVKETDKSITISVASDKGKQREIPRDEIDDLTRLKLSTMPAGLANLCGSRQGFLDLARFVIEINSGGSKRLNQLKKQAKIK